jgi:hypothetical protein
MFSRVVCTQGALINLYQSRTYYKWKKPLESEPAIVRIIEASTLQNRTQDNIREYTRLTDVSQRPSFIDLIKSEKL